MSSARAFAEGMIASTPNANARALACSDEIRHVNFMIGTRGVTTGDTIRLFLQSTPTDTNVTEVATFRIEGLTATLVALRPKVALHLSDRLARPVSKIVEGGVISLATLGGQLGMRSQLLTLSLVDLTPGCTHLGLDIRRASGAGATSVVFPDLLVERTEQFGDRLNQTGGIITGDYAPYPTRARCATVCPPCPPLLSSAARATFNFRNGASDKPGVEGRSAIGRRDSLPARNSENFDVGLTTEETQTRLLQQFRRAQLIVLSTSRNESATAYEASLRSYGHLEPLSELVVLRDGQVLSADSTFRELFEQTQRVLADLSHVSRTQMTIRDALLLSRIWGDLFDE